MVIHCVWSVRRRTYFLSSNLRWLWWRKICKRSRVIFGFREGTVESLVLYVLGYIWNIQAEFVNRHLEIQETHKALLLLTVGLQGAAWPSFLLQLHYLSPAPLCTPQECYTVSNIFHGTFKGGGLVCWFTMKKNFYTDWQKALNSGSGYWKR